MWRGDEKFPDNGFEAWGGYMQAKIAKLEEQFSSRAEKETNKQSDIFSGVSIYVNGYTTPSADELKTLMSKHGGVYHTYQRSEDYIIASNLPDTKVKKMSLAKVVKPEWITDSIKDNCLLDYRNYLLYRDSRTQPKLNFNLTKDGSKVKNNQSIEVKGEVSKTEGCNSNIETQNVITEYNTNAIEPMLLTDFVSTDFSVVKSSSKSAINSKVNEHQSNLKSDTKGTKTAADPNFISEFYNNSRLHHISQLGACFKQHVNDLRENSSFKFPAREDLKQKILDLSNPNNLSQINFEGGKTIMHIDMDCFFVSVGLRKRPNLVGKPVAVTHSKGGHTHSKRLGVDRNTEINLYRQKQAKKISKAAGLLHETDIETSVDKTVDEDDFGSMSEIASCSYEARTKGVHNGMFMGCALRLCPDLQTIPYDFEGYKEVAYTLYNTIAKYTLDIEAVSCDEMYVDCTELLKAMDISVQDFATMLRNEIKSKTGCPCSTGFGGNRLQARVATKKAKPDGQFFLSAELVKDFMFDIKLEDLPGVGTQTAHKLESIGHVTCGSLQNLPLATLQQHLGNKTGAQLFDQCRGHDFNPLTFHTVRKSVSAEVNYGIRFEKKDQCEDFLKQLSAEVHSRMQQFKVLGKCITLKLMVRAEEAPVETAKFMGHGFCNVINKSTSLSNATNDVDVITKEVISLCKKQKIDPKEMRGVGIQVTKLESLTTYNQRKGAISKFLCRSKIEKIENKLETKHMPVVDPNQKNKSEFTLKSQATTPKKPKVCQSPKKKSPVAGSLKSPSAKRKGRPLKNLKLQHTTSINLMNKFLQGQNSTRDTPYRDPMPMVNLISNEMKKTEDKPHGLLGFPWERIRELLRAWLESRQAPLQCDIDLITEYMSEMVISKNIDKLSILLRFFKRRTNELNSKDWIKVYDHVVENVQNAMIAVYGKRLCTDL